MMPEPVPCPPCGEALSGDFCIECDYRYVGAGRPPCPCCGRPLVLLEVHGHGQCAACKQVVAPCCQPVAESDDA